MRHKGYQRRRGISLEFATNKNLVEKHIVLIEKEQSKPYNPFNKRIKYDQDCRGDAYPAF